jgi:hypothetical protein
VPPIPTSAALRMMSAVSITLLASAPPAFSRRQARQLICPAGNQSLEFCINLKSAQALGITRSAADLRDEFQRARLKSDAQISRQAPGLDQSGASFWDATSLSHIDAPGAPFPLMGGPNPIAPFPPVTRGNCAAWGLNFRTIQTFPMDRTASPVAGSRCSNLWREGAHARPDWRALEGQHHRPFAPVLFNFRRYCRAPPNSCT